MDKLVRQVLSWIKFHVGVPKPTNRQEIDELVRLAIENMRRQSGPVPPQESASPIGSVLSINTVRLMEGTVPKVSLLEDCLLAKEDTLKRHDWEILNTEPAYTFSSGENCTITITDKRWFSLLRCKRCGKPIRVRED